MAEAATRLRAGELCALPTETVYGLAVLPSHDAAVRKARALKGRAVAHPFTWHVAKRDDLHDLVATVGPRIERLVRRYWPGPLTLVLDGKDGHTIGVRHPAHAFTREVIAACGEPLWLSSVNRTGEEPLVDAAAICAQFGDELALVVDDGPSALGIASSVVLATGDKLEVLREGIVSRDEVLAAAADLIVFVCTGNTCRSPLAEALARDLTARTIGCEPDDVLAHGYAFASAGTGTMDGVPASDGSLAAAQELGLDLTAHRSRAVGPALVEAATRIYCLGASHRRALLAEFPQATDKVWMLRQDGLDIRDPYGAELRVYRKVRDEIRAAIGARLREWLPG
ncbi:MAG: Sua5/YciO/YrdC/YwlC family protein [Planctomycetes bacterium]|nr:Sua5/YciO/YrdC/YwlC family protein [Planctomycetota bacterium]